MTSFHIQFNHPSYPIALKEIGQPPRDIWGEGDAQVLSEGNHVSIVGARQCTPYGQEVAFGLASALARAGVVVVSGLAYGIDSAAHEGTIEGGGKTIAVLGAGLDCPYPSQNCALKKRIVKSGAVITEFPLGTTATRWSFPKRNRIISGLARAVVVVEAGEKSGSLITANFALEQGRDVLAVPGDIRSPVSVGTHRLIQSGAKLVTTVEDILQELQGPVLSPVAAGTTEEKAILHYLASGPLHIDEIQRTSGYPVEKLSSILVGLEIGGRIKSLPGSRFTLNEGGGVSKNA